MKVARVLLLCLLPGVTAPVLAAEPAVDRVVVQGVPAVPLTDTLPPTFSGVTSVMATGPMPMLMSRLFPPTLIMQRQRALDLSERQTEFIKAEMRSFQSAVVDVQWDLQASQVDLQAELMRDSIDADAAAAAIDRVLAAENALKKLHLTLLIRIRNTLDSAQVEKLQASMPPHPWGWNVQMPDLADPPMVP